MHPHPRRAVLAVTSLVAAATVAAAGQTRSSAAEPASPGTPPQLFGVAPGATAADLQEAARRAGASCAPSEGATVCAAPLGAAPVSGAESFWFEGGQLARAFLVAGVKGATLAPYEHDFAALQAWVTSLLGPPARWPQPPPWWSSSAITPRRRLEDVVAGRATLQAIWTTGDAEVRLWLEAQQGQVRLVLGMTRVAAATDCRPETVAGTLMALFPPASADTRAAAARHLAACRLDGAAGALGAAMKHDPSPSVRGEALRALDRIGRTPDDRELAWLARGGDDPLARAVGEILSDRRARAEQQRQEEEARRERERRAAADEAARLRTLAERAAATPAAPAPPPGSDLAPPPPAPDQTPRAAADDAAMGLPPAPSGAIDSEAPRGIFERAQPADTARAAPEPPAIPWADRDGTPLAIASSTAAGALLMRNLGLIGLPQLSAQLLIGSAGAVIGFGTSWGLARFGFRPDLGQAMLYTSTTAWGTLAGYLAWSASGSSSPKLQYGSLVLGEAAGMTAGVWAARQWRWTPAQAVLADTFIIGAGLAGAGYDRMNGISRPTTTAQAIGAPVVMIASAIAAHQMAPTTNDLRLMTFGALGGGWTGGLLAAGAYRTSRFDSREWQGGAMIGAGVGYLAGAAAGAVSEVRGSALALSTVGVGAGNLLGFGLLMAAARDAGDGTVASADRDRWNLGAGIGGLALGAAAFAYAPHLQPGPSAPSMTFWGTLYGSGVWALSRVAAVPSEPRGTEIEQTRLRGGALAGAVAGGLTGLVASRWFAPDGAEELTATATLATGMAAGLGIARLTTDQRGTADAAGVLAGAGTGLAAGILFDRHDHLHAPDYGAGIIGGLYGTLFGALAPTLRLAEWNEGRSTSGGAWLGAAAGATAGAGLSHAFEATGSEIRVPTVAGLLGLGVGVGAGWAWTDSGSRAPRAGAIAGPLALMGLAIPLERPLHLTDPSDSTAPLSASGAAFGGLWGLLLAGVTDPSGLVSDTPGRRLGGGALMGASAGTAAGFVLSKRYDPTGASIGLAFAGSGLGTALGLGIPTLAFAEAGRHDTVGALAGSVGGMLTGAAAARLDLRGTDAAAGLMGGAYGALIGTLAPTMFEETWDGARRARGGALVGLSAGALVATAAAHTTDATPGQVTAVSVASGLGLGAGLGAGLMLPTDSLQPARAGTVVGPLAAAAIAIAAEPRLRMGEGLGEGGGATGALGAAYGIADGLLIAGAIDPSGLLSETPARRAFGGALMGASLEMGAGFVLSKRFAFHGDAAGVMTGGKLLGGLLGAGVARLAEPEAGRADTLAALGGSLVGLAAGGITEETTPLDGLDAAAAVAGLAYGGFLGTLAPRLTAPGWTGFDRKTTGGALAGLSLGAIGGAALRHATDASPGTIGLGVLGGADGLVTGLGVGLVAEGPDGDRAIRIGMAAGTAAGLGIGAIVWPRLTLGPGDAGLIAASTAVGGWTGLWLPALGQSTIEAPTRRRMTGGAMAGAGGASLAATLLVPALQLDDDLTANAVEMDAVFSVAGAGIGALASRRTDAPVWGLLAGGTAGLLAGGALHAAINLDGDDPPLLTLASAEGLWFGGWLPNLVRPSGQVTDRDRQSAVVGATAGAFGLAVLASGALKLTPGEAGYTGFTSAIGASIAGGAALLSPTLDSQRRVGLLLGGTGVGLLGGALLAPGLDEHGARPAGRGALGGLLGGSEALVFAWSGHATTNAEYGGAALIGAGVGAALGVASENIQLFTSSAPASAGFSAWGAWMGSFAGAMAARDAHQVVLGGLLGANAGLLGGQLLLRSGVVEPSDFGWLSLAGAMGTVAGAAVGAPLSSRNDPTPVLAGLAAGPAVGMLAGALVLPKLRRLGTGRGATAQADGPVAQQVEAEAASVRAMPSPVVCGDSYMTMRAAGAGGAPAPQATAPATAPARAVLSVDVLGDGPSRRRDITRLVRSVVQITDWAPMIGALPVGNAADAPTAPPMMIGVTGLWK